MDFFTRVKAVRLRSHHNKFLIGTEEDDSVKQSRSGSSKNARWSVETVDNKKNVIRLRNSQSGKYLCSTTDLYILGATGRRVSQASPRLRLDPTVEWEPIKEGSHVKLKTSKGSFLRANGGIKPWNNVTHDVPSRSMTQDWILWTVDVLDMEYESSVEIKGSTAGSNVEDQGNLSRNSSSGSAISKADYFKDCYEDASSKPAGSDQKDSTVYQVEQSNQEYSVDSNGKDQGCETLSRTSSSGSTVSKSSEYYKDCSDNEVVTPPAVAPAPKSVRSVRRHSTAQPPTESTKVSQQLSEKPTRVSPFGNHVHNEPQYSDSFNKLKSVLDGLEDLLDYNDEHDTQSEVEPELMVESRIHKPHQLEVKMAKHTLNEVKSLDYETVLSSGKEKKIEEAINVLIADVKMSSHGQVPMDLTNLPDELKSMREDHDSASRDLDDYTTFSTKRSEMRAELKKDASKAHELETLDVGLGNMIMNAKAKRKVLLKQLKDVENSIEATEKAQADNAAEIDELVSRIGEKSEGLRETERKEKSWQATKFEAEKKLERVEQDWVKMKSLFEDV